MPRPCILLADDDRQIRRLVGLTLENDDFRVCYAEDGAQAVRVAQEVRPQLALLDHQMPGLSGIEVCRALRADPRTSQMSIVMLTGQSLQAVRSRAFDAGADDFLTKPFSPRSLEEKVRSILAKRDRAEANSVADEPPASAATPPAASLPSLAERDISGAELSRAQLLLYAADLNRSSRELRAAHAGLRRSYLATMEALATALELRDAETQGHCKRVTRFTVAAARQIGIQGEELEQIRYLERPADFRP